MNRLQLAAIVFYAITVALGIGGFALAAMGHTFQGAMFGGAATLSALLAIAFAYAYMRHK